jgi:hypothetical protein
MNENEKRLFADVPAEDKEYMRVMASAKRSSIFMCAIWSVFAIVMGIMMKDLYMLLLILAMAALMAVSFFRTNAATKKKLVIYPDRVCYNNGSRDELLALTPEDYSIEIKLKPTRAGYEIRLILRDKSEEKKKLLEYVSNSLRLSPEENGVAVWQTDLEMLGCEIIDPQGIIRR